VQEAGRKNQAREDMAEQEVLVARLSEAMMWVEPGPLEEAEEQGELKRCDGVLVGQGVLEHLVMGSLGSLKSAVVVAVAAAAVGTFCALE